MAEGPKDLLGNRAVYNNRETSKDSLDYHATPPWAARALIEHVLEPHPACNFSRGDTIWEPAAGEGYLVRGLQDYTDRDRIVTSDVYDYGGLDGLVDFRSPSVGWPRSPLAMYMPHWVITNPPFVLAETFAKRCMGLTPFRGQRPHFGFALLCRLNWAEGINRHKYVFSERRPSVIAVFSERCPINAGRPTEEASTTTCYAWFVWSHTHDPDATEFVWIPPCRKSLEFPGDYDPPEGGPRVNEADPDLIARGLDGPGT